MKKLSRWAMTAFLAASIAGCVGGNRPSAYDESLMGEADAGAEGATSTAVNDEFGDFEEAPAASGESAMGDDTAISEEIALSEEPVAEEGGEPAGEVAQDQTAQQDELSLDDEMGSDPSAVASSEETPAPGEGMDEFNEFDLGEEGAPSGADVAQQGDESFQEPPAVAGTPSSDEDLLLLDEPDATPEPSIAETPAPEIPSAPAPMSTPSQALSTITGLKYKANDTGGTVLIEANGPITFSTRMNPELRQMIVEIPDSILPKRLQRPLNTRDIQGTVGAIDPYQNSGSSVSRFVIQLREGAPEPVVQQEGNTVLIVANTIAEDGQAELVNTSAPVNVDLTSNQVLASHNLDDYLNNNTKFFGKKISIEMSNMDIGDALRFITEESGVNMVVAEEVKGSVSLKLRQVPWDQALVVLMKAKSLGYTRQGNVLRIAPLEQLKKEEDDALKLAESRKKVEPLLVRMYPVSYSQVVELEKKVQSFLTERGKVVSDTRTNSLVVTDVPDTLTRIGQLIESLDLQPPQVMIEGRIVEAAESFMREIGVNWGSTGAEFEMGQGPNGPAYLRPTLSFNPLPTPSTTGIATLTLGTLDGLGDLRATLALSETENKVKIISSPRVVTMSNEPAKMSQVTEIPLRQTTQNGATTETTITYKPLSLLLDVTPQVTADASVIMKVQVKREFAGAADETGGVPINGREATTRVLVKNGETAVIGGIYQSDVTDGETGVPWLREIPVLGALFRGTKNTRSKTELLVFLTPRILPNADGGVGPSKSLKTEL